MLLVVFVCCHEVTANDSHNIIVRWVFTPVRASSTGAALYVKSQVIDTIKLYSAAFGRAASIMRNWGDIFNQCYL